MKLKNTIYSLFGKILANEFSINFLSNYLKQDLTIIYYHGIGNDTKPCNKLIQSNTPVDLFVKQLRFFKKHYNIVSIDDALEAFCTSSPIANALVVTFDDGLRECYEVAAPILLNERIPATFFLINDCIDNKHLMWFNCLSAIGYFFPKHNWEECLQYISDTYQIVPIRNLPLHIWAQLWPMHEKENILTIICNEVSFNAEEYLQNFRPYMSTHQIQSLIKDGFTVGAHSKTHPLLSKLNPNDLINELVGSSADICRRFKLENVCFSFPCGDRPNSEETKKLFLSNSFIKALLGINGISYWGNDLYSLERVASTKKLQLLKFDLFIKPFLKKYLTKL
ncbi:MAG: polysaccharide deacetylase family protein [bacterium]